MSDQNTEQGALAARLRARLDVTTVVAVAALALSGLSFYRSYLYTHQQLDVTVTDVSTSPIRGGCT